MASIQQPACASSARDDESTPAQPRLKLDFHTHLLPRTWPDFAARYGYGGFIALDHDQSKVKVPGNARMLKDGEFFREIEPNCWNLESRLIDMDRDGIDCQVVCTVPVMFNYWCKADDCADLSRLLNNDMANQIARFPTRFIGLGTVPMQAPELAVEELRRCVEDLGFPGVQIGSHVNDWNLDAPELMPFWAAAEELGAAVFIHPWDMELGGRHTKFWLPWLVGMPAETCHAVVCLVMGGVLERFPDLKVCFAHGAGSFPFTVGRIEHGYNCRPDLCATDCEHPPSYYLGKFHCDSITHDAEALEFLVGKMGEDKVVFGTDYPFPLGEVTGSAKGIYPGHALDEAKNLTVEQKDKVWSSNAFAFLGLDAKDFTPSPTGHTVEVKPPTAPVPTMASTHRDDDRVVGHVAAAGAAAADASAAVAALSLAEQCDDDQSSVDSTNAAPLP